MNTEDIKSYLPKYLSPNSTKELLAAIKQFPANIDGRLYTRNPILKNGVYQGDGMSKFLIVNLPNPEILKAKVMIFSNSCDFSQDNRRFFDSRVCYAPIFSLGKYIETLKENNILETKITAHVSALKEQKITQIFFLPKHGELSEDSLVFLDRVNNSPASGVGSENQKIFTLSDYGFYLFVLKLSIHFSRLNDGLERNI